MSPGAFLFRGSATVMIAYALFVLWMAAGLVAVGALAALIHGGLRLAEAGDRPFDRWPLLRCLPR